MVYKMSKTLNIIPARGERAFICGQTGAGKTAGAVWLLGYMPLTVIYDTKMEKKFSALPNSIILDDIKKVKEAFNNKKQQIDYVIMRPSIAECLDPAFLDSLLLYHYDHLKGVGAYLDEAFMFHNNSRIGAGLMGLLTRGRSRGITLTMAAQRPAWLSRFCLTESQKFYIYRLVDRRDRKVLTEVIPALDPNFNPDKYYFQYFDFELSEPRLFSPVPLDKNISAEYIDNSDDTRVWF